LFKRMAVSFFPPSPLPLLRQNRHGTRRRGDDESWGR
jgi:hypothetical protein